MLEWFECYGRKESPLVAGPNALPGLGFFDHVAADSAKQGHSLFPLLHSVFPQPKDPGGYTDRRDFVVLAVNVIVYLCSFDSSILFLRPTSQVHTCRAFSLWPSPTGPTVEGNQSPLGFPGFHTNSLCTCSGSLTPRVRGAARISATYRVAFSTRPQGRQPKPGDFGAQ